MYQVYECKTGKRIKGTRCKSWQKAYDIVELARKTRTQGQWIVLKVQ